MVSSAQLATIRVEEREITLAERLRWSGANIPVILLSGVVGLRDVAARLGTPYFLGRPYRFHQIMAIVDQALAERTPPRPTVLPSKPPSKTR